MGQGAAAFVVADDAVQAGGAVRDAVVAGKIHERTGGSRTGDGKLEAGLARRVCGHRPNQGLISRVSRFNRPPLPR